MQEIAPSPIVRSQEDAHPLTPEQKRALVQRVVSSQVFCRAPALRAFLLYITDHANAGQAEKLKEQSIGAEVLGRKPNYDPADDNIVRVRAHELRERLAKYFASEGIEEPVRITIPRGAYAPEYVVREIAPANIPVESKATQTAPQVSSETNLTRGRWLAFAAILLVAVSTSIVLTRVVVLRSENRAAVSGPTGAVREFWGQFFERPNEELKVVYSDSSFALWQRLNGKTLNLGDYLSRKYLGAQGDKLLEVAAQRATSPADITISSHLATLAGEFGGQVNLQFARDASADFLHQGNAVLIGSHRSNPWVEVYEPSLNFELEEDPHSGSPLFRNRFPHPQEAAIYAIPALLDSQGAEEKQFIQGSEEKEFTSYGVVALLKGCGDRGLTVLTEGLNLQATQAVGDLVTDPRLLDTLLQSIGHKPGTTVAPFEALIQITSLPGGYDNPKVVAYRLQPAQTCVGN